MDSVSHLFIYLLIKEYQNHMQGKVSYLQVIFSRVFLRASQQALSTSSFGLRPHWVGSRVSAASPSYLNQTTLVISPQPQLCGQGV